MYEKREQLFDDETKGNDYTVVMGDFNAVVGEGKQDVYPSHYGLGYHNDRVQMLVDFAKDRCISLTSGLFRTEDTWTKPGDTKV